ncbi:glycosyltransferase family 61 protein [Pseudomonas putida]|uniref:glycosyltransferase family 61 protein n=1 Tax=Pseudomonas putida TaxID=303 RepID=UPI000A8F1690|nr:glycosyltransferase family 61 protein [Pseudomonas putida]
MYLSQGSEVNFCRLEDVPCVESIAELASSIVASNSDMVRYTHQPEETRSFRIRRVWDGSGELIKPVNKKIVTESIDLLYCENAVLAGDFGLFYGQNKVCIFPFYRGLETHLAPERFKKAKLLHERLNKSLIQATTSASGVVTTDIYTFRTIDEPVFLLEKPHGHAYSHFIWDTLSDLWWVEHLPKNVKVLVSNAIPSYQKDLLTSAGLSEERIIWRNGREHINLSKVYVPSFCAVNNRWISADALDFLARMRRPVTQLPKRLVFFDRGGDRSGVRCMVNEDVIWSICQEYGFERHTPASLSFAQKQEIFSETAVMVGQFGGGIQTHFLMQQNTSILCLHSDRFIRTIFDYTSSQLRQSVFSVIGTTLETLSGDPNNSNFMIDPDAFRVALEQTLRCQNLKTISRE